MQRGYLQSRDILLNSIFGEANADNAGATLVWDWIAWPIDDSGYSFSVYQDGSNAMRGQVDYMNSKVPPFILLPLHLKPPGLLLSLLHMGLDIAIVLRSVPGDIYFYRAGMAEANYTVLNVALIEVSVHLHP